MTIKLVSWPLDFQRPDHFFHDDVIKWKHFPRSPSDAPPHFPPVPVGFPSKRPVTQNFDVFFDLLLNKRLSKQSRHWWFEMPSRWLWRQCNDLASQQNIRLWYILCSGVTCLHIPPNATNLQFWWLYCITNVETQFYVAMIGHVVLAATTATIIMVYYLEVKSPRLISHPWISSTCIHFDPNVTEIWPSCQ